jgi:hypothetical protein
MPVTATFAAVLIVWSTQLLAADPPTGETATETATAVTRRLSGNAAIDIALADLKGRKIDMTRYKPPTATFSPTDKGGTWSVFFGLKEENVMDGCFWVFVNDRSGKVDPVYGVCG